MLESERITLSIRDAAKEVSVSRRTIHSWIFKGKIQYKRTITGHVRIYKDSLWKDSNSENNNVSPRP